MSRSQRGVRLAVVFLAGVVLVLALIPQTSRFVQSQLLFSRFLSATGWITREARFSAYGQPAPLTVPEVERAQQGNSTSLPLRLAFAHSRSQLRDLVRMFPTRPAVYAAYLDAAVAGEGGIRLQRPDYAVFHGSTLASQFAGFANPRAGAAGAVAAPPLSTTTPLLDTSPMTAQDVADADQLARTAERLDPGNAFFPAVRAIILFSRWQDVAALSELHRAATAQRWESYAGEVTVGRIQVLRLAFGETTGVNDFTASIAPRVGLYTPLQELEALALFKATTAAKEGSIRREIAIRHDLIRWGSLMAVSQGSLDSVMGSWIGFMAISPARTADAPDSAAPAGGRGFEYEQYLLRVGHPQEAQWVIDQEELQQRVQDISKADAALPGGLGAAASDAVMFIVCWSLSVWLLGSTVAVLLSGCVASQLLRSRAAARPRSLLLLPVVMIVSACIAAAAYGPSTLSDGANSTGLVVGLWLVVPAIIGLCGGVRGTGTSEPFFSGAARAAAAAALPTAAVLLLLYVAITPGLAVPGRSLAVQASQQLTYQNSAMAARTHQAWPTDVPA